MTPVYHIKKLLSSANAFPLDALTWKSAEVAHINSFLPQSSVHHPPTTVQMLYDSKGIWTRFKVIDRFVRCVYTEFQQPVYRDAAVEFFIKPVGADGYFNFEFNICGAMRASYVLNPEKDEQGNPKRFIPLTGSDYQAIKIKAPFRKSITAEIVETLEWHLQCFIPFTLLKKFVNQLAIPERGSIWTGNFYKCAENNSHPHWAAWAPVPELNFHLPKYFGKLQFEG